jgi:hypothetical protein
MKRANENTLAGFVGASAQGDVRSMLLNSLLTISMTTKREFTAGNNFTECSSCGPSTEWKLR